MAIRLLSPVATMVGVVATVARMLVFGVLFGLSVRADAADHPVSNESGLRTAIASAADGESITFHVGTQVFEKPGGVPGAKIFGSASADAVYSNLQTFRNQSFAAGGATQQFLNTITRMAADDLNLVGTPPYSINGFRFIVTNLNAVDVSARPLVRFYLPDGPGGGPGTLIESRTYNPTVFHAGVVGTIKTSSQFVLRSSHIWAGVAFDNNGGTTGATAAQLDNLALGIFSPPDLGTSTDQYFVTTAAGSIDSSNPAGALASFGGAPPADFGWEILTAQDVDLSITKSASVATTSPGGSVVYTITASNAGPDTVFGARVVDTFPASLTCSWTCAGSAGNTCAASGTGDINDGTVDLAVGGSVTYTATCAVSPAATGTLVNTATFFTPGTAVDANIANNTATNVLTLTAISPPTIAMAFAPLGILVNGTTTLTFTLTNPNPGIALSGVGFTDTLPPGLTVADGATATCGGTLTTSGGNTIALAGATIAPSGPCMFPVTVTATAGGLKGNITSAVTSAEGGTGGSAVAFLVVVVPPTPAPPTIAKAFGAASIAVNGTTTLTFTLTNPNPGIALSGVGFTDTLPPGLTVADGATATCGGTLTTSGGSTITLAGATIAPSGTCTFSATVTGTTAGAKNNTTSAVTSAEGGTGGTASASLAVIAPPTIAKAFGTLGILLNGTTTLTFTLTNPNAGTALSGVGFTDNLPSGLVVAAPNGQTGSCGGGTVTALAGSGSVALVNGGLAAGGSCTITLNVTSAAGGLKSNITSPVSSNEGGTGGTAVAFLVVVAPPTPAPPTIAKAFATPIMLVNKTTTLTFTLTNPNPVSALTGVAFTDTLPPGLTVADGATATCGGTLTTSGGNTIALAGATIAPSGTCTFPVTVTGTTAGTKNNTTGAVTSTEGGTGGTASASLAVVASPAVVPPTIAKAFGTPIMLVDGTTTLTFTLTNPNPFSALTGVGFTDDLPSGLVVATPNGLTDSCGGTLTAVAGAGSVGLVNGSLPVSGSCTITLNVTGTAGGAKSNITSAVTSTEGGTGGTAMAFLVVLTPPAVAPPTIAKAFGTPIMLVNGTTTLTFTLTNPNPVPVSGVAFTDMLPPGLTVANGASATCGGALTTSGGNMITLAGAAIAPSGTCTFPVTVTGTIAGVKNNTTSAVTSTEGSTGGTASASLLVVALPTVVPPTIAKAFGAASIVVNETTTLTFTLTNPNPVSTLSGVGFTDTLPPGLTVANGASTTCGGTLTTSGGSTIALAGATIAPSGTCTFSATVTGTTAGAKNNTTSAVTSVEGGTGGTASASLVVVAPPTIAKAFGAASIVVNGTTTLTFTLTNPNAGTALSGMGFTDNLPAGLVVGTPNGLTGSCGGGTVTALAGSGSVELANGSLPASGSCTITVSVTGAMAGAKNNTTGAVTSTEGGTGGTASASITVEALPVVVPPTIAKAFGVASIVVNGTTTLTFTLTNPNAGTALSGMGFTDNLPAGLVVGTPNGLTGSCGGGTVTALAGSGSVELANGSLPASGSCTITVSVTGATAGAKNNTTGAVTSTEGGTGGTASANITVVAPPVVVVPPTIAKAFGAPTIIVNGTTTLTFTLTNPNAGTALTGVGFTDNLPAGLMVGTPNGLTNTCGGTVTAVAGTGSVALANGGLPASGSCTITLNVTGATAGAKNNTTSAVTSTEGGTGGTASASLTVVAPQTIAKAFGTPIMLLNGTTTLRFTLNNPNAGADLTGVRFTDNLPAGLVVGTPSGLISTCGGTVIAVAGAGSVALLNGGLSAGGRCTIRVNITSTTTGVKNNTTSAVISNEGGTGGTASANIAVVPPTTVVPPTIDKDFGVSTIIENGTTTLTFTLTNPNPVVPLTGVSFTDPLPGGLVVGTPNGLTGSCGGGTITATAGATTVDLAGATLAGGTSCVFAIVVRAVAAGRQVNTTNAVMSTNGGVGGAATASITVLPLAAIPTLSTFALAVLAIVLLLSGLRRKTAR